MNDYGAVFWCGVILSCLVSILITPRIVRPSAMTWAVTVCEANDGLDYLRPETHFVYNNKAVCKNGAEFYMRKNADEQ